MFLSLSWTLKLSCGATFHIFHEKLKSTYFCWKKHHINFLSLVYWNQKYQFGRRSLRMNFMIFHNRTTLAVKDGAQGCVCLVCGASGFRSHNQQQRKMRFCNLRGTQKPPPKPKTPSHDFSTALPRGKEWYMKKLN